MPQFLFQTLLDTFQIHSKFEINALIQQIVEYHEVIKNPIALDIIKNKLNPDNEKHYTELKQVMADIRLMFKNAYTFNPVSKT